MKRFTALVKGTVFDASAAAAQHLPAGTRIVAMREKLLFRGEQVETRVVVEGDSDHLEESLAKWFCMEPSNAAPFPPGAMLHYSEGQE